MLIHLGQLGFQVWTDIYDRWIDIYHLSVVSKTTGGPGVKKFISYTENRNLLVCFETVKFKR